MVLQFSNQWAVRLKFLCEIPGGVLVGSLREADFEAVGNLLLCERNANYVRLPATITSSYQRQLWQATKDSLGLTLRGWGHWSETVRVSSLSQSTGSHWHRYRESVTAAIVTVAVTAAVRRRTPGPGPRLRARGRNTNF